MKNVLSIFLIIGFLAITRPVNAGTSYLDVISEPDGVTIYINGEIIGKTPLTGIEVKSGDVKILAKKNGFGQSTYRYALKPDELRTITIRLKTVGEMTGEVEDGAEIYQDVGDLLVINKLGNKMVKIDGVEKDKGSMKIKNIAAGDHTISVDLGLNKVEKRVTIYKKYLLKVEINKNGIFILNDLDKKRKAEEEAKRKKEEEVARLAATRAAEKKQKQEEEARAKDPTTGMEFVLVKGGCYQMGNTFDVVISTTERPVHQVCVDDFFIGKYEVTQEQYKKITGSNPTKKHSKGSNHPVGRVSWNDVQSFIVKFNRASGRDYRLPTEAEWEYAARSGGKQEMYAGGNDAEEVAWNYDNSVESSHPVGRKQANGLGIHDMSGNVSEWCSDWYEPNYYKLSPRDNPTGPSSGTYRVLRGGAYTSSPISARAAKRGYYTPKVGLSSTGFRLVLPAQR